MTRIQFHLPQLRPLLNESFPKQCQKKFNPHFSELESAFNAWIDSAAFLKPSHKQAWKYVQVPLYVSCTFPNANFLQLQTCLYTLVLALLLEELTDTASSAETREWVNLYISILNQDEDIRSDPLNQKQSLIVNAMREIFSQSYLHLEPVYRTPLVGHSINMAESFVRESLDREAALGCSIDGADGRAAKAANAGPSNTTLDAYIATRRASIGILPVLDLVRWIMNFDLPIEVLDGPLLQEATTSTLDMMFLMNDLYSYKKELLEDGASHNFITVVMRDPKSGVEAGDIQAAVNYTEQQFRLAVARFRRCAQLISMTAGAAEKAKVVTYLDSIIDAVAGNVEWSGASKRYDVYGDSSEAEREFNIVTIRMSASSAEGLEK